MPTLNITCQVEGCTAPLHREYHQRYRICEVHSRAHVERDGVMHRFCQQCGRFQPLEEFDGTKRSCRERLLRHNERRRKKGASFAPEEEGQDTGGHPAAAGAGAEATEGGSQPPSAPMHSSTPPSSAHVKQLEDTSESGLPLGAAQLRRAASLQAAFSSPAPREPGSSRRSLEVSAAPAAAVDRVIQESRGGAILQSLSVPPHAIQHLEEQEELMIMKPPTSPLHVMATRSTSGRLSSRSQRPSLHSPRGAGVTKRTPTTTESGTHPGITAQQLEELQMELVQQQQLPGPSLPNMFLPEGGPGQLRAASANAFMHPHQGFLFTPGICEGDHLAHHPALARSAPGNVLAHAAHSAAAYSQPFPPAGAPLLPPSQASASAHPSHDQLHAALSDRVEVCAPGVLPHHHVRGGSYLQQSHRPGSGPFSDGSHPTLEHMGGLRSFDGQHRQGRGVVSGSNIPPGLQPATSCLSAPFEFLHQQQQQLRGSGGGGGSASVGPQAGSSSSTTQMAQACLAVLRLRNSATATGSSTDTGFVAPQYMGPSLMSHDASWPAANAAAAAAGVVPSPGHPHPPALLGHPVTPPLTTCSPAQACNQFHCLTHDVPQTNSMVWPLGQPASTSGASGAMPGGGPHLSAAPFMTVSEHQVVSGSHTSCPELVTAAAATAGWHTPQLHLMGGQLASQEEGRGGVVASGSFLFPRTSCLPPGGLGGGETMSEASTATQLAGAGGHRSALGSTSGVQAEAPAFSRGSLHSAAGTWALAAPQAQAGGLGGGSTSHPPAVHSSAATCTVVDRSAIVGSQCPAPPGIDPHPDLHDLVDPSLCFSTDSPRKTAHDELPFLPGQQAATAGDESRRRSSSSWLHAARHTALASGGGRLTRESPMVMSFLGMGSLDDFAEGDDTKQQQHDHHHHLQLIGPALCHPLAPGANSTMHQPHHATIGGGRPATQLHLTSDNTSAPVAPGVRDARLRHLLASGAASSQGMVLLPAGSPSPHTTHLAHTSTEPPALAAAAAPSTSAAAAARTPPHHHLGDPLRRRTSGLGSPAGGRGAPTSLAPPSDLSLAHLAAHTDCSRGLPSGMLVDLVSSQLDLMSLTSLAAGSAPGGVTPLDGPGAAFALNLESGEDLLLFSPETHPLG